MAMRVIHDTRMVPAMTAPCRNTPQYGPSGKAALAVAQALQEIPTIPTQPGADTDRRTEQPNRRSARNVNLLLRAPPSSQRAPVRDPASGAASSVPAKTQQGDATAAAPGAAPAPTRDDRAASDGQADRVLDMARSAGLYSGHPEPSQLSDAQRQALAREVALNVTGHIDWTKALGPDARAPDAVYYDGFTLRNATQLTIDEAATLIEKRIRAELGKLCAGPLDHLVRALRDNLIGDPTLSLREPPQSIRYGSFDWACLWDGIQKAKQSGLDFRAMRAANLACALSRTSGLVRMANAAGKLSMPVAGDIDSNAMGKQLSAYAKELYGGDDTQQEVDIHQAWRMRQLALTYWTHGGVRRP
jgi:hypothetical protein